MKDWSTYQRHNAVIVGSRKKCDNTIYTFDIETTSYIKLDNTIYPPFTYKDLTEEEKIRCKKRGFMYIWMLSINKIVYCGRTWNELRLFLDKIEENCSEKKIFFIHNLRF